MLNNMFHKFYLFPVSWVYLYISEYVNNQIKKDKTICESKYFRSLNHHHNRTQLLEISMIDCSEWGYGMIFHEFYVFGILGFQ